MDCFKQSDNQTMTHQLKKECLWRIYADVLSTAFQFQYNRLSYLKNGTYMAYDHKDKILLVSLEDVILTIYKYTGFLDDYSRRITYVKHGFFGESSVIIALVTGK